MRILKLGALACVAAGLIVSILISIPPGTLHEKPQPAIWLGDKPTVLAERFRSSPVLAPDPERKWRGIHCGMACVLPHGTGFRVWYTGKEADRKPYTISRADFDSDWNLVSESSKPVLEGTPGGFDGAGVFMPSVVDCGDHLRMYYACHSGGPFPGSGSSAALAISRDGGDTWEKVGQTIPADGFDSYGVGTNFAWKDDDGWRMLYTHVEGVRPKMRFFIKSARSSDGITWERPDNNVAIDHGSGTCSRPMVFKSGGRYILLYSNDAAHGRGERNYRIRWADSVNGWKYIDRGKVLGIEPTNDWENELVSYGWALPEQSLLLYTGDWFGAKGFGVARLKIDLKR